MLQVSSGNRKRSWAAIACVLLAMGCGAALAQSSNAGSGRGTEGGTAQQIDHEDVLLPPEGVSPEKQSSTPEAIAAPQDMAQGGIPEGGFHQRTIKKLL